MALSRRAFGASMLAVASGRAVAQTPRSYAVVSEFARDLNVVFNQESTGTRLGNDIRKVLKMPDGALDKVALLAARDQIRKIAPGSSTWLVAPMETDLLGRLRSYDTGDSLELPADIADEMKKRACTHLLLMTRLRAEGELQMADSRERTPALEGVGFYVNRNARMRNVDSGEFTYGYLAPFMYARLVLIDAATSRVSSARSVRRALVYVNTRKDVDTSDPWMTLTNEEKGPYLASMIQDELAAALPPLLGGA